MKNQCTELVRESTLLNLSMYGYARLTQVEWNREDKYRALSDTL